MKKIIVILMIFLILSAVCGCSGYGHDLPLEKKVRVISAEAPKSGKTIEYDENGAYIKLTLPEGWDHETIEDPEAGTYGFAIHSAEHPDKTVKIRYFEAFGMCGTGITFEEVLFENGLSGHKCTEGDYWTLFTFTNNEFETYTVECNFPFKEKSDFGKQLISIINCAEFGDLTKTEE